MLYSYACWINRSTTLGVQHLPNLSPKPGGSVVRFYRRSIQGVQSAILITNYFCCCKWMHNHLMMCCEWGDQSRMVYMHNLILHNRKVFGYTPPIVKTDDMTSQSMARWQSRLQIEYNRANEFDALLSCRLPLTVDALRHIFSIWRPTPL